MTTILIIDDEDTVRYAVRSVLEQVGHTVLEAENGNVAMDIIHNHPIDVALVDIIMPEKEGMETTYEILNHHPNIKVIGISGGGRNRNYDFLRMAEVMGAHATLKKPFTDDQLLETLSSL